MIFTKVLLHNLFIYTCVRTAETTVQLQLDRGTITDEGVREKAHEASLDQACRYHVVEAGVRHVKDLHQSNILCRSLGNVRHWRDHVAGDMNW